MGVVWAALNVELDREVALKLIEAPGTDIRVRLLREAKAYARLDHPNVVRIHDVGRTEQGDPFLVMELLTGRTLAERIKEVGKFDSIVAVRIVRNVARALRAAHEAQIVHRDLKPANIFLHDAVDDDDTQGAVREQIKVLDFGVSKLGLSDDTTSTATGVLVGSPAYMSPEQAHGVKTLDGRTDLWALGVVLFEMLAGRRPFLSSSPMGVIAEILERPIPRLASVVPGVDSRLDELVARCMTRDIQQRIPSARAVLDALRGFEIADDLHVSGERVLPIIPERPASFISAPDTAPLPGMEETEEADAPEVFQRAAPSAPDRALSALAADGDSFDDQQPTSVMNRTAAYYFPKRSAPAASISINERSEIAPPINPRMPAAVEATLNLGETTEDTRPTSPMAPSSPDPAEIEPLSHPAPVFGAPPTALLGSVPTATSSTSALIGPSDLGGATRDESRMNRRIMAFSILGGFVAGGILLLIVIMLRGSSVEGAAAPASPVSSETAGVVPAPTTEAPPAVAVEPSATPTADALLNSTPSASAAEPTSTPKRKPPPPPPPPQKRKRGLPPNAG
jgi:serine/threonine-protein kinase